MNSPSDQVACLNQIASCRINIEKCLSFSPHAETNFCWIVGPISKFPWNWFPSVLVNPDPIPKSSVSISFDMETLTINPIPSLSYLENVCFAYGCMVYINYQEPPLNLLLLFSYIRKFLYKHKISVERNFVYYNKSALK